MSEKIMSRSDVVSAIAQNTELPHSSVEAVVKEYEAVVARQLEAGGEIRLPGFATFKISERSAREARNPRTGEALSVAARSVVRFVPGKTLKEIGAAK